MRITNKVMQNNALTNINQNKELQDSLNTQLSTGKKVYKPSDDPVTAIRSLRIRTDVSQVNQYYKKNVPDAKSWLDLTESAVKTTVKVVTDMIVQCEKGSSDTLTTSDRKILVDALKQLRDEVYTTGDADYAGRYIFTGYRTGTSLSFPENVEQTYSITQHFSKNDINDNTYTVLKDILSTPDDVSTNVQETAINQFSMRRIRLAYDNLDGENISLNIDGTDYPVTAANTYDKAEEFYDAAETIYKNGGTGDIIFCKETGEIIIPDNIYSRINSDSDINISYDKTHWNDGDLRPQHYFYCETTDAEGNNIVYNEDYLTDYSVSQEIEYQVGFSQYIRVNTCAEDIYKHDIGRDVDEILELCNRLTECEDAAKKLKDMSEDTSKYGETELANIEYDLEAANKAVAMLKDDLQKRFSKSISYMQGYLDDTDEALTVVGNRSSRLDLIENRLETQSTTFKTLQSDNEDADATEVAVQLSSAQVNYEAALMATSEMIQKTLLNYL